MCYVYVCARYAYFSAFKCVSFVKIEFDSNSNEIADAIFIFLNGKILTEAGR